MFLRSLDSRNKEGNKPEIPEIIILYLTASIYSKRGDFMFIIYLL